MPRYVTTYTVEGSGQFPVDMLRYDASYPADEESSYRIPREESETVSQSRRQIHLRHVGEDKRWLPTLGRWESLTWRVLLQSINTRKA